MSQYLIYMIVNKVRDKAYIGMTSRSLADRWSEHLSRFRGSGDRHNRLYQAMRKYGPENFDICVVDVCDTEDAARHREERWIIKLNACENGYNCNYGGCGQLHPSDETKDKIRNAQIGKYIPIESRIKMSIAKLGRSECADNFGTHTEKGAENPKAGSFLIRFPDGTEEVIKGLRQFCRDHSINQSKMSSRGCSGGYTILKRFRDHPEREYTQVGGSGAHPVQLIEQDEDMVQPA